MNATVTLPIGDLDKLRDDLKSSYNKIEELKKSEREMVIKVYYHHNLSEMNHLTSRSYEQVKKVLSYTNMNDVIEPLRLKIQEEEREKIESLRREIEVYKGYYETNLKKINNLNNQLHDKETKKSEEDLNKKVKEQDSIIKVLSDDIIKANEQIKTANKQLSKELSRTWWDKLLNRNK